MGQTHSHCRILIRLYGTVETVESQNERITPRWDRQTMTGGLCSHRDPYTLSVGGPNATPGAHCECQNLRLLEESVLGSNLESFNGRAYQ